MATNISRGQTGSSVSQLQQQLINAGVSSVGKTDGVFGSRTDAAVREFQKKNNLTVDGIVGPQTMAALQKIKTTGAPTPTAPQDSGVVRPVRPGSSSEKAGIIGYGQGGNAIYGSTPSPSPAASSDPAIEEEKNTQQEIANFEQSPSFINASQAHEKYLGWIEEQAKKLQGDYQENVALLNQQFDRAEGQLKVGQGREQAITAAKLQRIGGYLGESGSAMGVTSNQIAAHRAELESLAFKRAEAINAAKNAYTKDEMELAKLKMKQAQDFEETINERRNQFIDNVNEKAKQSAAIEKARLEQENKIRDDARTVLNTMITSFGGFDLSSMDEATQAQLTELADAAGYPIAALRGPTLTQSAQANTERQRQISNAIAQANLSLSRQRLQKDISISASEAEDIGLPRALVGADERVIASQLQDGENVPDWFIETKYPDKAGGIIATQSKGFFKDDWNKFRNEVVKTQSKSGFDFGFTLPSSISTGVDDKALIDHVSK